MIVFDEQKYGKLENDCNELLSNEQVRFAGIVNKLGNLIAGGYKDGTNPFETDEKCRMMYMQMALELSMRQEFDSSLGIVNYIASKRENALMISIPINENLLLISAISSASTDKIVDKALQIFSKHRGRKNV